MQAVRSLSRTALSARAFSTTAARPLAKMQLIGRLADVPEVHPTSSGRDVIRYSLGVSYGGRDESGDRAVSWFRAASFIEPGPRRDLLTGLPKGSLLYIEADARMETYEKDGTTRSSLNLLTRNFEVLSRPRQNSEQDIDAVQQSQSGLGAS